jgi:hypothetical protein
MSSVERIVLDSNVFGIIVRSTHSVDGIEFFTTESDSQQLGYMKRPNDYSIAPHRHNLIPREVHLTQEVLFIRNGRVRVDFYSNQQEYITSRILESGDVILLADGGHGFKMLEPSEIIEVKQGPYCGESDKVRFNPVDESMIRFD